nr:MAG TPA: hypothetical protein [Bacteriophage sp.]
MKSSKDIKRIPQEVFADRRKIPVDFIKSVNEKAPAKNRCLI